MGFNLAFEVLKYMEKPGSPHIETIATTHYRYPPPTNIYAYVTQAAVPFLLAFLPQFWECISFPPCLTFTTYKIIVIFERHISR